MGLLGEARGEAGAVVPIDWRNGAAAAGAAMNNDELRDAVQAARKAGERHVVVRFARPVTDQQKAAIRAAGVELLASLGTGRAWFARLLHDDVELNALGGANPLQCVERIDRAWKVHPQLAANPRPAWATVSRDNADAVVAMYVLLHRGVDQDLAKLQLEALGAMVRTKLRTVNALVLELPSRRLWEAAAVDDVQWIEAALPPLEAQNDLARVSIGADVLQAPPYELDGSEIHVMVFDTGAADGSHPDLAGRVFSHDASGATQHATHVSGIIGGTGAASAGLFRGMAPNVVIDSYAFEAGGSDIALYNDPGDMEADYDHAINIVGVDLANNSIGSNIAAQGLPCELEGDYSVVSAVVDSIVAGGLGRELLLMWAAGNERIFPANCGQGWRTIPPPATAKNSLVVGAVYSDFDLITTFTSYGPTDDGRTKPDVVAPGCEAAGDNGVTSTNIGGGYMPLCGTSMAAPAVSGVVALLLEDFRAAASAGTADPSPAMIKATLVNTALDLWHIGPDYRHGYGLVRAELAVEQMRSGNAAEGMVEQDEVWESSVIVAPGTTELMATIAWSDPPGQPNVGNALVNDIDLIIVGPDGEFYPWTLNPAQPSADAVRTQPDRRNNLEQVHVDDPTPGIWQLQVIGFDVPEGPQKVALVASSTLVRIDLDVIGGVPSELPSGETSQLALEVEAVGQALLAQSLQVFFRRAGETVFAARSMPSLGGSTYGARLPAAECGETIEFYFSAAGSITGQQFTLPEGPMQPFRALVDDGTLEISISIPVDPFDGENSTDDGGGSTAGAAAGAEPIDAIVVSANRCIDPRPVGDIDENGAVDAFDLALLLGFWDTQEITADFDANWTVDPFDLAILLGNWSD